MQYLYTNKNLIIQRCPPQTVIVVPNQEIEVLLDSLATSIFDNIDSASTLDDLVEVAMRKLAAFGSGHVLLTHAEMREELDLFLFSLLQQGVLSLSKQAHIQPCYFGQKDGGFYVYTPFKRLVLQLTRKVWNQLKSVTVNRYTDLSSSPQVPSSITGLVDYLNTPIALNENESFHFIVPAMDNHMARLA